MVTEHMDLLLLVHPVVVEVRVVLHSTGKMDLQYIQDYKYISVDALSFYIGYFDHIVRYKDQHSVDLCKQDFVNSPDL